MAGMNRELNKANAGAAMSENGTSSIDRFAGKPAPTGKQPSRHSFIKQEKTHVHRI
jgi:hypothetical protein